MMAKQGGTRMEELKAAYLQTLVPAEVDDAIRRGIAEGHAARRRRRSFRTAGLAAAALAVLLVASAGFSPTLSAYMGKLPMLQYFQFLSGLRWQDGGVAEAIKTGYMQSIDKAIEHDGVKVTLDDLVVDETRMVGMITIDATDYTQFGSIQSEWIDADTGAKVAGHDSSFPAMLDPQTGLFTAKVGWFMPNPTTIPDHILLKVHLYGQRKEESAQHQLKAEWEYRFTLDKSKFAAEKQVVDLNQTVTLAGQKVTFLRATLLPTTTRLDFTIDPNNTKQIFKIEDLRLVDDTGRVWKPLNDNDSSYVEGAYGLPYPQFKKSQDLPPDVISIYFEGSYLANPSSLKIMGSTIRALDKDKLDVLVDLDKQKLLQAPDDRLKLKSAKLYPQLLEVIFEEPRQVYGQGIAHPTFEGYSMERVVTPEEYSLKLGGRLGGCGQNYLPTPTQELCFDTKYKDIPLQQYLTNPLDFRIVDYGYDKLHVPFEVKIK